MRIALVGYGKMGGALLAHWCTAAELKAHEFTVIDPSLDVAAIPPAIAARATFLAEAPSGPFDCVIVAVKPQVLDTVLPAYADRLADGGFVASIAAGCSIERLRALAGGVPVVRIMPNLPAAIGAGVSGLCADPSATAAQRDAVEALMSAVGVALWVADEDRLDRLTAVAGSGPGYGFEISRAYVDAAEGLGFDPATARLLVLGTLAGTIAMAQQSDEDLSALRNSVTSKGGTTAAGLAALNGDGTLDRLLHATLDAAYARAVELR